MDANTNEFPYLTILLLFRAGLHQEAVHYCTRSSLPDVRTFGYEIYQKCTIVFGGKLPQEELASFLSQAAATAPDQYDVCRDALVHLMTGNSFVQ